MIDQREQTIAQVRDMLDMALALRKGGDPLLAGQIDGLIGRLTALLAVLGALLPPDLMATEGSDET